MDSRGPRFKLQYHQKKKKKERKRNETVVGLELQIGFELRREEHIEENQ
jgi:hypothetical protein